MLASATCPAGQQQTFSGQTSAKALETRRFVELNKIATILKSQDLIPPRRYISSKRSFKGQ